MNRAVKRALKVGISIFLILVLLDILKGGFVLMLFVTFTPGFLLGLTLICDNEERAGKNALFLLISIVLYIVCFWITDVTHEKDKVYDSLKLIAASGLGSFLLSLSYSLIFKTTRSVHLIILSFAVGLLSAIPSAIFMYLFKTVNHYPNGFYDGFNFNEEGLMAGIFTIFPLWQTAFVWVMNSDRFKPVSQITATAA